MVSIGLFTWYHKNPTFATIVASPKITEVDHEVNKLTSSIGEFQVQMHVKVYTNFLMHYTQTGSIPVTPKLERLET